MSTMWGADADALDALAAQVRTSGRGLDGTQARLGRSIHASPWRGPNAERFRQQWDAEYRRSMTAASSFLDDAGEALERNADQQRTASTTDGPGTGPGAALRDLLDDLLGRLPGLGDLVDLIEGLFPGGEATSVLDDFLRWVDGLDVVDQIVDVVGPAANHIRRVLERNLVHVRSYVTKAGKFVSEHFRWRPGVDDLRKVFGGAARAGKLLKVVRVVGPVGTVLGGVFEFAEQWTKDGDRPLPERIYRAGVNVAGDQLFSWGGGAGGAWAGAGIGSLIAPGPGTVIGAGIGFVVGSVGGSMLWDVVDGPALDAADWVWDNAPGAVDWVGGAVSSGVEVVGGAVGSIAETGGDIIDAGGDLISDGANFVTDGIGSLL